MFKVLTCIQQAHDLRLVLVAAAVCLMATATTVWLYGRIQEQHGVLRIGWLALTGIAAGSGVWATHFIAMLAYAPDIETGYDLAGTSLSLILAIGSAAAGFAIAARSPRAINLVIGGAVVGGGVGLMHYVGMMAFRPKGFVVWDTAYVNASLLIGVVFSIAALFVAGRTPTLKRTAGAVGMLTLAICGLHFTAMAAATIVPDSGAIIPAEVAARPVLAIMVVSVAVLILVSTLMITAAEAMHSRTAVNRLRIATDGMPAALAVFDANDRLVVWNTTYQKLRPHYGSLLKPGLSFEDMVRADGFDEAWISQRKHERREGRPLEVRFPGDKWVRIENMPTADGGLITVGVDVTELKRHAATLSSALEQAEAANRAKSEFLANMSHEIRTPLNGVAGVADVLAGTRLTKKQQELVGVIRASAETVDSLLGEILDLSRIEAGQTEAVNSVFHLGDAVRAVVGLHRPKAPANGIALTVDLPKSVEAEVVGDPQRLKQILSSLLSNAIKFTDHGEVAVTAAAMDGGVFRIEVRDTGVGFDAAVKQHIFEPFAQADGSATRRHSGAGLGLTIARKCADLLDAKLDCESTPGEGSVFSLEIPLVKAAPALPAAVAPPAPEADPFADRSIRVLIVDDNPVNRRVLELILSQVAASWHSVGNGQEALDALETARFDAILMDIQMPVMDGLTATREIRRREHVARVRRTPVVMVSANCMPEHIKAGREAGAERFLPKPINAAALLSTLAVVIETADQDDQDTQNDVERFAEQALQAS